LTPLVGASGKVVLILTWIVERRKNLMRALVLGIMFGALVVAPAMACGPNREDRPLIPPLAVPIDDLLPRAQLADVEREKLVALRAQIGELAAAGQQEAARRVEEDAMRILGFSKAWANCGPGTFIWVKFS
jgi:hypothetical protein